MLNDFSIQMANMLAEYSIEVKPGDHAVILTTTTAAPLAQALFAAILERGGHPVLRLGLPHLNELFLARATDDQLAWIEPGTAEWMKSVDVYITIDAPHNPKALGGIDPARMAQYQQARQEIYSVFFGRLQSGEMRYLHALWPTDSAAQQAEMGLLAFREFVYKACGLDQPDPVAYWRAFQQKQERLVGWLEDKKRCDVRGPGIELSFNFEGRTWVSCHGRLNMPDGEIYTCPVEDSVNGHVAFSYPSTYGGTEVEGVELTFKDGVVTAASAAKAEGMLLSQLDMDEGARRLGEFAIGTNMGIQRYTGNTLFDEKIGGTIHMALGNSAPMAGGQNQSGIHWDMVHGMQDGGEIRVDGELFYQNGQFVVE